MRALHPLVLLAGSLALLASGLAVAVALRPVPREVQPAAACSPRSPCLAIVIDDVGRDTKALDELLALPIELTFAVLPHAAHTKAAVARLQQTGREYLLHLPMAPLDPSQVTDETVLISAEGPISSQVSECLDRVPGAVGVNNHMGSGLSQDDNTLREILQMVDRQGLWVLDSRTTPRSHICAVAEQLRMPCIARDLFLDDPPDSATITHRLREAFRRARRRGKAVLIGHPLSPTISALRDFTRSGFDPELRIVRLSTLVQETPNVFP